MLALVFAVALSGQSPKAEAGAGNWTTVALEGTKLAVEMPVAPKKISLPAARENPEKTVYQCRAGGGSFSAMMISPRPPIANGTAGARFDLEWRAHRQNNIKGEILDQKLLILESYPGREVTGKTKALDGTVTIRSRYFLVDDQFCVLMVFSAPNEKLPQESQRFLDSIRIAGKNANVKVTYPLTGASPEEAVRNFMIAMAARDENTLRGLLLRLDHDDDFRWLMAGRALTAPQTELVKSKLMELSIKALKPGDTYKLGRNGVETVGGDEVDENHAVLLPKDSPVPIRAYKVEGVWRVDARPIIASRKAIDAVRKKAPGAASEKQ